MTIDAAEAVRQGVEALRIGRADVAVTALALALADAEFAAAADLVDVRARVLTLYAQALVDVGSCERAKDAVVEAMRAVRRLDDDDGMRAIKAVQAALVARIAADRRAATAALEQMRLVETAIDALLEGVVAPDARADVLLAKANALIGADRRPEGRAFAEQALAIGVDCASARAEVLARLSIARAVPDLAMAQLTAALARAEAAGEFNLVGTIARAAELHGITLPKRQYAERSCA